MKWSIPEIPTELPIRLYFDSEVVCVGSCFAENMYSCARERGLPYHNLPFGTIFHPLVLAKILNRFVEEKESDALFEKENKWFSWDASTKFFKDTKSDLEEEIANTFKGLFQELNRSTLVLVTFGTSYGYQLSENGYLVANCHKQPPTMFNKRLFEVDEMAEAWIVVIQKMRAKFPNLNFIFTVSPVRHLKDGVIENNRSKSRLLLLCEKLEKAFDNCYYFPAYEMMMDEWRDYRFYKEDKIHPTQEAISEIWKRFTETIYDKQSLQLMEKVKGWRRRTAHQPIQSQVNFQKELMTFLKEHPQVKW